MLQLTKVVLDCILGIAFGIFEPVMDFLMEVFSKQKDTAYSAEFGNISDQLERSGNGFRIGYKWGNSLQESHSHLICLGGSGSKKSSCIGFPLLLQSHDSSYVVFDTSGEYFNGTAAYNHSKFGYKIDVLNFDDYTKSIGINVLPKCANEMDVYKVAQTLSINANSGSSYDYWMQSSENLIGFFSFALFKYAPKEYVNLANVLHMLQVFSFDSKRIDKWIVRHGDERMINRYKSIVATPEKTLLSTVATALNTLSIYSNPNIAAITSHDTFSFESMRQERRILYLCGSPITTRYARGVSACFFESFFSYILQKLPERGSLPITFLLDECATMRLNTLPKILELGRKYSISIATLWQDYGQIEHIFGRNEAANILANSRLKVYMPSGQPLQTCKMLEELLGRYSFETEKGVQKSRELLTAQEIFQLRQILVLNGNNKPMIIDPKPYFLSRKLRSCTEFPVYELPKTSLSIDIPLIQFE